MVKYEFVVNIVKCQQLECVYSLSVILTALHAKMTIPDIFLLIFVAVSLRISF